MTIRKEQPGAAKAAATTGVAIGAVAREKEDRARVEREQVRADQEAAQRKARQTAMAWDLKKMQINSERAFERELRQEDYRLMAEDRAQAWQVEKMELASRMDFERSEGERQRKLSVLDNSEAALDKAIERGEHTEDELAVQNKRTEYKARRQAIELGETYREPRQEDAMAEYLRSLTDAPDGAGALGAPSVTLDVPNPLPSQTQTATNPKTGEKAISHDGGKTWEPVETPRVIPPANTGAFRDIAPLIRNAPFFQRGKK